MINNSTKDGSSLSVYYSLSDLARNEDVWGLVSRNRTSKFLLIKPYYSAWGTPLFS